MEKKITFSDVMYDLQRRFNPSIEVYYNRYNNRINKDRQNKKIKKWLRARLTSKAAILSYGFILGFIVEWWFVF